MSRRGFVSLALAGFVLAGCNLPKGQGPSAEFATALAAAGTQGATPSDGPTQGARTPTPTDDDAPGGQIVYTCQTTKNSETNQLCRILPDGSGGRLLTFDETRNHFFASVAPEGESVLFSSNRDSGYEIYELGLNGGAPVRLTTSRDNFAPAVSPDGKTIAFTHSSGPELWDGQIWLMERDGGNPGALTDEEGGGWDPSWSPDGGRILFATHTGGKIQLAVIQVETGEVTVITGLTGLRGRNDWSIHGLLATYIGSAWEREIITFGPEGGNVTYVTDGGNNLAPSFSPDGGWIAITSYRDNTRDEDGCEIYILRATGGDIRRLTDNDYCDWQPRWGPLP
ncbi:MAG: PD40 domain-containing protein [Chloroflexi bacterium]|nr:PD40 domain-containing protein [Chloroflexota bacterium]